jgi:hypothetical protein
MSLNVRQEKRAGDELERASITFVDWAIASILRIFEKVISCGNHGAL